MANLTIPETIKDGLLRIAALTDEQFQELYLALENLPLRIDQRRIFDYKGLEIRTIPQEDLESIQDALFPLYIAQETTGTSSSTYVKGIIQSLQKEGQESQDILKERLIRLLGIERPKLIAKANDVLVGHTPTYLKGRILSDIRPVFPDKVEDSPQAAVIVHVLRINYIKDDKEREFIVALDNKDIQLMIDILERAKTKTEALHSIISSANMNSIDVV